jgi:hypothetical protein
MSFHNDSLYKLDIRKDFDLAGNYPENISFRKQYKIVKDILATLKIDFTEYTVYRRGGVFKDCTWRKENGTIDFLGGNSFIIIFEDIKISFELDKIRSFEINKKTEERLNKGSVKIENSPWDGSVRQVEKYLKSNLKDPKSYESIEWGLCKKRIKDIAYIIRLGQKITLEGMP